MLPYMNDKSIMRPSVQTSFGGLNHNRSARDGEIYNTWNMSSREYPLLSTRERRKLLGSYETPPRGAGAADGYWWVCRGYFYYNGQYRAELSNSDKEFAAMGNRIIIFPDKKIYNTEDDTMSDMEASVTSWARFTNGQIYGAPAAANTMIVVGDITSSFKVGDAVTITGIDVNDPTHPVVDANDKTAIIREMVVDQYRVSGDTMADCTWLRFDENCWTLYEGDEYDCELTADLPAGTYHYTYDGQNFQFTTTETLAEGGKLFFKSANIRWVKYIKNNVTTAVGISEEGDDGLQLTFIGAGMPYTGRVTISRDVPDLDYICVHENRLWGCKGDTIYASKLGDPTNFNVFDGLDTDSWTSDTVDAGDFTACISFMGYPTFFKEESIYKVQGDAPSNFSWTPSYRFGVKEGANRSLAVAGETLFYLSRVGICAYAGSSPTIISAPLGVNEKLSCYAAGSDGIRYYISLYDETEDEDKFCVFDTRCGIWHQEDDLYAPCFFFYRGGLYLLDGEGDLWFITGETTRVHYSEEEELPWTVEFADMTRFYETTDTGSQNKKGLLRLQLRCELAEGSSVTVYVSYDGGSWHEAGTITSEEKNSYNIPLILRRCDYFRIKLEGSGEAVIYSLTEVRYSGSNLQGGKVPLPTGADEE